MNGLFNEMTYFNGVPEPIENQLKHIDDLGGPLGHNHYAAGWAVAGDTPFTWTKQVASSYGGTRNVSMLSSFNDAKAPENHLTQYFEMFGNRGVYSDGWLAGTVHRAPWETKVRRRSRMTSGSCTIQNPTSA